MSPHTAPESQAFEQERRAIAENRLLWSSMRAEILQLLETLNDQGNVEANNMFLQLMAKRPKTCAVILKNAFEINAANNHVLLQRKKKPT